MPSYLNGYPIKQKRNPVSCDPDNDEYNFQTLHGIMIKTALIERLLSKIVPFIYELNFAIQHH